MEQTLPHWIRSAVEAKLCNGTDPASQGQIVQVVKLPKDIRSNTDIRNIELCDSDVSIRADLERDARKRFKKQWDNNFSSQIVGGFFELRKYSLTVTSKNVILKIHDIDFRDHERQSGHADLPNKKRYVDQEPDIKTLIEAYNHNMNAHRENGAQGLAPLLGGESSNGLDPQLATQAPLGLTTTMGSDGAEESITPIPERDLVKERDEQLRALLGGPRKAAVDTKEKPTAEYEGMLSGTSTDGVSPSKSTYTSTVKPRVRNRFPGADVKDKKENSTPPSASPKSTPAVRIAAPVPAPRRNLEASNLSLREEAMLGFSAIPSRFARIPRELKRVFDDDEKSAWITSVDDVGGGEATEPQNPSSPRRVPDISRADRRSPGPSSSGADSRPSTPMRNPVEAEEGGSDHKELRTSALVVAEGSEIVVTTGGDAVEHTSPSPSAVSWGPSPLPGSPAQIIPSSPPRPPQRKSPVPNSARNVEQRSSSVRSGEISEDEQEDSDDDAKSGSQEVRLVFEERSPTPQPRQERNGHTPLVPRTFDFPRSSYDSDLDVDIPDALDDDEQWVQQSAAVASSISKGAQVKTTPSNNAGPSEGSSQQKNGDSQSNGTTESQSQNQGAVSHTSSRAAYVPGTFQDELPTFPSPTSASQITTPHPTRIQATPKSPSPSQPPSNPESPNSTPKILVPASSLIVKETSVTKIRYKDAVPHGRRKKDLVVPEMPEFTQVMEPARDPREVPRVRKREFMEDEGRRRLGALGGLGMEGEGEGEELTEEDEGEEKVAMVVSQQPMEPQNQASMVEEDGQAEPSEAGDVPEQPDQVDEVEAAQDEMEVEDPEGLADGNEAEVSMDSEVAEEADIPEETEQFAQPREPEETQEAEQTEQLQISVDINGTQTSTDSAASAATPSPHRQDRDAVESPLILIPANQNPTNGTTAPSHALSAHDSQSPPNIYDRFLATYPSYTDTQQNFICACVYLSYLQDNHKHFPQHSWDDLVRIYPRQWAQEIKLTDDITNPKLSGIEYYCREVNAPVFNKRVLNTETLEEALGLDRRVTRFFRQQYVKVRERRKSRKSNGSMRSVRSGTSRASRASRVSSGYFETGPSTPVFRESPRLTQQIIPVVETRPSTPQPEMEVDLEIEETRGSGLVGEDVEVLQREPSPILGGDEPSLFVEDDEPLALHQEDEVNPQPIHGDDNEPQPLPVEDDLEVSLPVSRTPPSIQQQQRSPPAIHISSDPAEASSPTSTTDLPPLPAISAIPPHLSLTNIQKQRRTASLPAAGLTRLPPDMDASTITPAPRPKKRKRVSLPLVVSGRAAGFDPENVIPMRREQFEGARGWTPKRSRLSRTS